MNLLGLVFGLLLIFSCCFSLSMHKQLLSNPVETSCKNNLLANRKILNSYEKQFFSSLRSKSEKKKEKKITSGQRPKKAKKPLNSMNQHCSHLNLWPLLVEGREEHPGLYETAARLLRCFYANAFLSETPLLEYTLLDSMIRAAKEAMTDPNIRHLPLEKLSLAGDLKVKQLYTLQNVYYRMLKGTKEHIEGGYPPLVDYLCFESTKTRLCLGHASASLFRALFGDAAGRILYEEMHGGESKTALSKERIASVCSQQGLLGLPDEFFELLDCTAKKHRGHPQKILVEKQGDVSLRKRIFLPG